MKSCNLIGLILLVVSVSAIAQNAQVTAKPLTDSDIQLLRQDVQSDKEKVIKNTMQFTESRPLHFGRSTSNMRPNRRPSPTAKDPILFRGQSVNFYGYVLNDPVNLLDPSGLQMVGRVGIMVDGRLLDPNAPLSENMNGPMGYDLADPYCKKDTPIGKACLIKDRDPREPEPNIFQKAWNWITKQLAGSDEKFNVPCRTGVTGARG